MCASSSDLVLCLRVNFSKSIPFSCGSYSPFHLLDICSHLALFYLFTAYFWSPWRQQLIIWCFIFSDKDKAGAQWCLLLELKRKQIHAGSLRIWNKKLWQQNSQQQQSSRKWSSPLDKSPGISVQVRQEPPSQVNGVVALPLAPSAMGSARESGRSGDHRGLCTSFQPQPQSKHQGPRIPTQMPLEEKGGAAIQKVRNYHYHIAFCSVS